MSQCKPSSIQVAGVVITQDAYGRYSLNDLHRAAGGEKRHQPSDFLRLTATQELVAEIHSGDSRSAPVETVNGGPARGTYACREMVYAYAMWVAPKFHLQVIRTFDAVATGQVIQPAAPAFAVPRTLPEALRLAADLAEQVDAQRAQLVAQAPAVEFLDRFVEAKSTKGIRAVAKVLGLKEKAFIAQLESDGVVFRQGGKLLPKAEHQHAGYFEVKTGEANGHAYTHMRFTPAGIAWVAERYAMAKPAPLTLVREDSA
jgi:anti-repressor protein